MNPEMFREYDIRGITGMGIGGYFKSNPLTPLYKVLTPLFIITFYLCYRKPLSWSAIIFIILCSLMIFVYIFALLYIMFKDINLLRSEKFLLRKKR